MMLGSGNVLRYLLAHLFNRCGQYTYWEELEVHVTSIFGCCCDVCRIAQTGTPVMYVYYTNV